MHYLMDISGSTAGFIYQNTIVHPISLNVFGVILGHCVYGLKGKVIGKFFDHHLYDNSGEIVAITSDARPAPAAVPDLPNNSRQAWQILDRIENYVAPWIQPKNTWSAKSLQDVLGQ